MSSKQNTQAAPSTGPQTLKIGSRVHCTDDHVEGRIVWANGVSVKIRWDDGEQVTWRRDSLAGRPIEILAVADEEQPGSPSAAPSVPATPELDNRTELPQARPETAPAPTEPTTNQAATPAPEPPPAEPAEPAAVVAEPLDVQTDLASGEPAQPSAKPKRQRKRAAEPKEKKLSALDAAAKILGEAGQPMGCKELIGAMAAKGYWASPAGRTPGSTLYAAILRELNTKGDKSRFQKAERGKFALATAG